MNTPFVPKNYNEIKHDFYSKYPNAEGNKKYTVINSWSEDGIEWEWEPASLYPVSIEEAEIIKHSQYKAWTQNAPQHFKFKQKIVLWNEYLEMFYNEMHSQLDEGIDTILIPRNVNFIIEEYIDMTVWDNVMPIINEIILSLNKKNISLSKNADTIRNCFIESFERITDYAVDTIINMEDYNLPQGTKLT